MTSLRPDFPSHVHQLWASVGERGDANRQIQHVTSSSGEGGDRGDANQRIQHVAPGSHGGREAFSVGHRPFLASKTNVLSPPTGATFTTPSVSGSRGNQTDMESIVSCGQQRCTAEQRTSACRIQEPHSTASFKNITCWGPIGLGQRCSVKLN